MISSEGSRIFRVSDHTFNDFIPDPFLVTKPSQCQIHLGFKVIVKIEKIRINTLQQTLTRSGNYLVKKTPVSRIFHKLLK
jgi:hypothetical protein